MRSWPLYPAAFAAAFILRRYLETGEYLPVMYRALTVLVIVAVVLQLVMSVASRSRHRGAYVGTVVLTAILDPLLAVLLLLPVVAPLVADLMRRRAPHGIDWPRTTALLNIVAAVVLLLNGASTALRVPGDLPPTVTEPIGSISAVAPDIYVILLDEYPRADTLQRVFGFDNTPFLEELGQLGFEVAERSHSNYNATTLTLASLFSATQVPELLGPGQRGVVDGWDIQRNLNSGRGLDWLHRSGYTVTSITSGVSTDDLRAADEVIDTGQITTFEASVLRAGILPRLLSGAQAEWQHAQQRDRIRGAFASLVALASEDRARPRFVFAHLMTPHAPIVFDAQGNPVGPHPCLPAGCSMWDGRRSQADLEPSAQQLAYTNKLVAETARSIQANSEVPPVIIVMSDHGSRYDDINDPDEMFRNLFVSLTPGKPGLFPDDMTPINLIPRLLNAYAGAELPLASEESYLVKLNVVLEDGYQSLVPWPQT